MDNDKQVLSLNTPLDVLEQRIYDENNLDELNSVIELFNINIKKKEIARTNRVSNLQDKILDQIEERIEKHGHEFSNKDLLDYFKTAADTINKFDASPPSLDSPSIQINQNNINVSVDNNELSRDSRERVLDVVNELMKNIQDEAHIIDTEAVVIEE